MNLRSSCHSRVRGVWSCPAIQVRAKPWVFGRHSAPGLYAQSRWEPRAGSAWVAGRSTWQQVSVEPFEQPALWGGFDSTALFFPALPPCLSPSPSSGSDLVAIPPRARLGCGDRKPEGARPRNHIRYAFQTSLSPALGVADWRSACVFAAAVSAPPPMSCSLRILI